MKWVLVLMTVTFTGASHQPATLVPISDPFATEAECENYRQLTLASPPGKGFNLPHIRLVCVEAK